MANFGHYLLSIRLEVNSLDVVYRPLWNIKYSSLMHFERSLYITTRRDRPKSAPYQRLKYSKKTSKCQGFLFYKTLDRIGAPGAKRGTLSHFLTSIVAKNQKIEGWKKIGEKQFSEKILTMPKNLKGGPFGIFQHPFCCKTLKIEGGSLGNLFSKKSLTMPIKNWKARPFSLTLVWCVTQKKKNPFWFSSLDQMIQFGTIKFCRTFVELFWSDRVDWKKKEKRVTIIVAFHFMKRRLKSIHFLVN